MRVNFLIVNAFIVLLFMCNIVNIEAQKQIIPYLVDLPYTNIGKIEEYHIELDYCDLMSNLQNGDSVTNYLYDKIYSCHDYGDNRVYMSCDASDTLILNVELSMELNKEDDRLTDSIIKFNYLQRIGNLQREDTVYIIENKPLDHSATFLIAWNSSDTIVVDNANKLIDFRNDEVYLMCPIFPAHMMKLVAEWDIGELEKEERLVRANELSSNVARRIIASKGKVHITCISFLPNYELGRDWHLY